MAAGGPPAPIRVTLSPISPGPFRRRGCLNFFIFLACCTEAYGGYPRTPPLEIFSRRPTLQDAWKKALIELKKELPSDFFDPFIKPLVPVREEESPESDTFFLGVQDRRLIPHLKSQYREPIQTTLRSLMGRDVKVEFLPYEENERKNSLSEEDDETFEFHTPDRREWLNPHFRFRTFLRGKSNELALQAAKQTALLPGKTTPLFLFGDPGLGKTHLAQSILHALLEKNPRLNPGYFSISDFKDEFLAALSSRKTLEFKNRYRDFDMIVVEDIQYLRSTAELTQEEFFHIFNYYYEKGKQIIITSDRPALHLHLTSRLMSRVMSGLPVFLAPTDRELRMRFLKKRAEEMELPLSEGLLEALAQRITGSIRELESALNKLFFLSQQGRSILGVETLDEHFQEFLPAQDSSTLEIERILEATCKHYNISREEILSNSRKAEYTLPRHIAMYLAIQHSRLNKSSIARFFRRSDHTTVINAERKIRRYLEKDASFASLMETIVDEARRIRG